jgi:hypothetical protein
MSLKAYVLRYSVISYIHRQCTETRMYSVTVHLPQFACSLHPVRVALPVIVTAYINPTPSIPWQAKLNDGQGNFLQRGGNWEIFLPPFNVAADDDVWVVAPCSLLEMHRRFRGVVAASISWRSPQYTVQQPRRQPSTYSPPREPEISRRWRVFICVWRWQLTNG